MGTIERRLVEITRAANAIGLVVNPNDKMNRVQFAPVYDRQFAHDIAIALQSYYTREQRRKNNERKG